MPAKDLITSNTSIEDKIKQELKEAFQSKRSRIFSKILGAALGSITWVGGFLSASISFKAEENQIKNNQLLEQWLDEHSKKIKTLGDTLVDIIKRLNESPEDANERLESEDYLNIVRKGFRIWDSSDTEEKKDLVRKLLTNAGAHKLVPDDLIGLFLDWINQYHEVHFAVIKAVFQTQGISRYEIWQKLNGANVREDSLEADLFKLIIRDLSTGSVIRQIKQTDYNGNFIKKTPKRNSRPSTTHKSAFDEEEGYELTELGAHFVHYTMNEVVPRIS